jgi:hypothetical protein
MRLTRKQVNAIASAMSTANADQVDLSYGEDGRLLVKQVLTVEKFKALKVS